MSQIQTIIPEYQRQLHREHLARQYRFRKQAEHPGQCVSKIHEKKEAPVLDKRRANFLHSWQHMCKLIVAQRNGAKVLIIKPPKIHPFDKILNEVSAKHRIGIVDIKSNLKHHNIVMARREIAYRCRRETSYSSSKTK